MKRKILVILIAIVVLPLIIIGSILQIIGRFITALSYLFWFERRNFVYEVEALYEDMKIWIDLKQ